MADLYQVISIVSEVGQRVQRVSSDVNSARQDTAIRIAQLNDELRMVREEMRQEFAAINEKLDNLETP